MENETSGTARIELNHAFATLVRIVFRVVFLYLEGSLDVSKAHKLTGYAVPIGCQLGTEDGHDMHTRHAHSDFRIPQSSRLG